MSSKWCDCICFILLSLFGTSLYANPSDPGWDPNQILDLTVLHRETARPLEGVLLEIQIRGKQWEKIWKQKTDSQGYSQIALPAKQPKSVRVYLCKQDFVPLRLYWASDPTPVTLPKTYSVAMEPGMTIGGTIQDDQGQPINKATVCLWYLREDLEAAPNARVNIWLEKVKTNEKGQWRCSLFPGEIDTKELRILLRHPDYLSDNWSQSIPIPLVPQPPLKQLHDCTSVMIMKSGLELTGKVIDNRGKPIAGAMIKNRDDFWWQPCRPAATTDSQGYFRLTRLQSGKMPLIVQAPGYAPDSQDVHISPDSQPLEFCLKPGRTIRGRVIDSDGKPIPDAVVQAMKWRALGIRMRLFAKTDLNGQFVLSDTPTDPVFFDIGKDGYVVQQNYEMVPSDEDYTIILEKVLRVSGSVTDAATGRPVPKVKVMTGIDHCDETGRIPRWDRFKAKDYTEGSYEVTFRQKIFAYRIRAEAEGYMPKVSRIFKPDSADKGDVVYDFELEKSPLLKGQVIDANGTPLANADVILATHDLRIHNGLATSDSLKDNRATKTNNQGQFSFSPEIEPYILVVLHDSGYSQLSHREWKSVSQIRITPWSIVTGNCYVGPKACANRSISLSYERSRRIKHPQVKYSYETQTDMRGHYAMKRVLPGQVTVSKEGKVCLQQKIKPGVIIPVNIVEFGSLVGHPLPDINTLDITSMLTLPRDKRILIFFWDIHQRPARNMINQLAQQAVILKQNNIHIVSIHVSEGDDNHLRQWLLKNQINLPVVQASTTKESRCRWGIRGIPWTILTDKEHRIQAEGGLTGIIVEVIEGDL